MSSVLQRMLFSSCALAIAVVSVPARADFIGNLVQCAPTAGVTSRLRFSPGMTCDNLGSDLRLFRTVNLGNPFDNCTANVAAPWAEWRNADYGSRITALNAALISSAEFRMPAGFRYGTCNQAGGPTAIGGSGAGRFRFRKADGTLVPRGRGSFFAFVEWDVATTSLTVHGVVTAGFAMGASIEARLAIDLVHPDNGSIIACYTGALCPPPLPSPIDNLWLQTDANSRFRIDFPDNSLCTGPHEPMHCCSGIGSGSC